MRPNMDFAPDIKEAEERLAGKDLAHFKSRVHKAANILAELAFVGIDTRKTLSALCVGSGLNFIPYIVARHTAWEMHAGDINERDLFKYPWVQERIRVTYLDATAMHYPDNTFDLVICNHVIEHVHAWEKLASEVYRVVKPGGVVYVATPNLYGLYRTDVPFKVLFQRSKKTSRDVRITLHMGLSLSEVEQLLADFSHLENFNRTHMLLNSPPLLKLPLSLVPATLYHHFAPNHVVLAKK